MVLLPSCRRHTAAAMRQFKARRARLWCGVGFRRRRLVITPTASRLTHCTGGHRGRPNVDVRGSTDGCSRRRGRRVRRRQRIIVVTVVITLMSLRIRKGGRRASVGEADGFRTLVVLDQFVERSTIEPAVASHLGRSECFQSLCVPLQDIATPGPNLNVLSSARVQVGSDLRSVVRARGHAFDNLSGQTDTTVRGPQACALGAVNDLLYALSGEIGVPQCLFVCVHE